MVGKVIQGKTGPASDGSHSGKQVLVLSCHIVGLLGHTSLWHGQALGLSQESWERRGTNLASIRTPKLP